jgi:CRP-like cAMP-binding protein
MREHLRRHITERLGYTPADIDRVLTAFEPLTTRKNETLVEVGKICHHCYFIVEGCIKLTAYNRNGQESTTHLVFENEWATAMCSFINQQRSTERVVSVEASRLLAISRATFREFADQVEGFQLVYRQLLEESYTKSLERTHTFMGLDGLERLRWLLAERPLIFTRLSNRLLASYLGMSEATLSRLKAKL